MLLMYITLFFHSLFENQIPTGKITGVTRSTFKTKYRIKFIFRDVYKRTLLFDGESDGVFVVACYHYRDLSSLAILNVSHHFQHDFLVHRRRRFVIRIGWVWVAKSRRSATLLKCSLKASKW